MTPSVLLTRVNEEKGTSQHSSTRAVNEPSRSFTVPALGLLLVEFKNLLKHRHLNTVSRREIGMLVCKDHK